MLQKQFERKVTYYDMKLHRIVEEKNENTVTFDSRSEFRVWQLLRAYCKGCYVTHPYEVQLKAGKKWRVDFAITACSLDSTKQLGKFKQSMLDCTEYSPEMMVLLEYKGTIDENFRKKATHIAKYELDLFDDLILVSHTASAFVVEDLSNLKAHVKVIRSTDWLKGALDYAFN